MKASGSGGPEPAGAPDEQQARAPFPIVGIGASAGGLEAFTQLLSSLPQDTGMAFVLVQHLDPRHESKLPDLLARSSRLPVLEGEHGLDLRPDHVYVIPPNADMAVARGLLVVTPRAEERRPHLPVDHLFRSLAEDQEARAIGVVLSGTGSDGTLGLAEIKAVGGITFAQDEKSAGHAGMPRSAVDCGSVDFVLPPAEIAHRLVEIGSHPYLKNGSLPEEAVDDQSEEQFRRILARVRGVTRVDFSDYRDTTIKRRILRRMALNRHESLADYAAMVETTRGEVELLYHDLLINVTSFFRDPGMFEALKRVVFPEIVEGKSPTSPIRVWVPGCSTGQECYSLAIALVEFFDDRPNRPAIQIFATDLGDATSLEKARAGIYPESIEADVDPERLRRFFKRQGHVYRIDKAIRDMCVFARHNLIADPPFSHVDLISCRNVLIYMAPPLQKRVIPTFHHALDVPGFLVLGTAESVGEHSDLFQQVDRANKIYSKKVATARSHFHFAPGDYGADRAPTSRKPGLSSLTAGDFQREADRLIFGRYAPPGVLLNESLEVLQFRGRTSPYLEPPPGEPTVDVLKMAREGLFLDLRSALVEAKKTSAAVRREQVRVRDDGHVREIDLLVHPVRPAGASECCFLVLFEEIVPPEEGGARRPVETTAAGPASAASAAEREVEQLRREVAATKEYMQSLVEQQDASNEELRSANEEILSSNEELQSTNEELETAKEELQSANEELTTVNEQLLHRNAELSQTTNDLTNLLSSMTIPLVVVGSDLRVRLVTPAAKRAMNLLPADIGRPLAHIKTNLSLADLEPMIAQVIENVQVQEREVQDGEGRWYMLRIHPYRTADNRIDGAVLALIDIDQSKRVEQLLRESEASFREKMQCMPHVVWTNLPDGKVDFINRRWLEYTGQSLEYVGSLPEAWMTAIHPEDRDRAVGMYLEAVQKAEGFSLEARLRRVSDNTYRWHLIRAVPLESAQEGVFKFLGTCTDIEDLKEAEKALLAADRRKDEFLAVLSHELRNPLGAIRNAAQLMREASDDPKTVAKARDILQRQTDQMILLVDDLLDMTRVMEGKIVLKKVVVPLTAIVDAAVENSRTLVTQHEHELTVSLPSEPVYLEGDSLRLTQVLTNLLTNAAKFTPPGGKIALDVRMKPGAPTPGGEPGRKPRETRPAGQVEIRVRDNGVGMSADLLPRVFDMFVQAEQSLARGRGGLGVGLTLVRSLVVLHGGEVEARSDGVGKGTEVTVRLPVAAPPPKKPPASQPDGKAARPAEAPSRRILVVEDNRDYAESLQALLEHSGHEVRVAMDGRRALEAAREFAPDVALIDIGLPGLNGYEVAKAIRKSPGLEKVVLAALTGYGQESDRRRAEKAGFDHHFVKPVDFNELRSWLEPVSRT